jgi:hypothetical protein
MKGYRLLINALARIDIGQSRRAHTSVVEFAQRDPF